MLIRMPAKLMLLLALFTTMSCTRVVVWFSKEEASWSFIQARCSALKLGEIETTSTQIIIPIDVHDKLDSAICMYDAKGRVSGHWIEITVKKGLCSGGPFTPLVARVSRPEPGDYQIVYAGPNTNYPILGKVHVD